MLYAAVATSPPTCGKSVGDATSRTGRARQSIPVTDQYAGSAAFGPGFLGFRMDAEWLMIAIWVAGDWFRLDGRLLTDMVG
jgi:hypothetical protein